MQFEHHSSRLPAATKFNLQHVSNTTAMCHIQGMKQRTWSTSAKLAASFPGLSFVTWLVLCNHQRFCYLGYFCEALASCWASKRSGIAALLWCAWVLPRTVKIGHNQSRFCQTFTCCFFYMPTIPHGPSRCFIPWIWHMAVLLWCAWVLPRTVKIRHNQSRFCQTFTRCFFYIPRRTQEH